MSRPGEPGEPGGQRPGPGASLPSGLDAPAASLVVPGGRRHRGVHGRWLLLGVVSIAAITAVLFALITPGAAPTPRREHRPASEFQLPELQDPTQTISFSDLRGRAIVLNFWASWCVPCRREARTLEQASRAFAGQVTFLGVDHQDGSTTALDFINEFHVSYPSGYDPDGNVAPRFGLIGLPSTLFISPDGEILGQVTGAIDPTRLRVGMGWLIASTRHAPASAAVRHRR